MSIIEIIKNKMRVFILYEYKGFLKWTFYEKKKFEREPFLTKSIPLSLEIFVFILKESRDVYHRTK